VAASAFAEVENQALTAQDAVGRNIKRPDLSVATGPGVAVDDVERLVVGRDGQAIRALNERLAEDANDLAVGIDSVNGFGIELQRAEVVAVIGVGKPDAAECIHADVVRTVVTLALITIGQDRELARFEVGTNHSATAARTHLRAFATDQ